MNSLDLNALRREQAALDTAIRQNLLDHGQPLSPWESDPSSPHSVAVRRIYEIDRIINGGR